MIEPKIITKTISLKGTIVTRKEFFHDCVDIGMSPEKQFRASIAENGGEVEWWWCSTLDDAKEKLRNFGFDI